jgi:hypothetical protein
MAEPNLLDAMRDELALMRWELQVLREQVRLQRADIARLDDTLSNNVLQRLRALETRK